MTHPDKHTEASKKDESVPLYIEPKVDERHCDPSVADILRKYFAAKNTHQVEKYLDCFSLSMSAYSDAVLGWKITGYKALHDLLAGLMPKWGTGRSYATRVLGGPESAIVFVTDTPELFGGELHAIAAVNFLEQKVIRWVDYWDSSAFPKDLFNHMAVDQTDYPSDFGEQECGELCGSEITHICNALHDALANSNHSAASALFAYDATFEDMALRISLVGRSAISGYLSRLACTAPFSHMATIRHIVGGKAGGGYEWIGGSHDRAVAGITAITFDEAGLIDSLTMVYDSKRLGNALRQSMTSAVSE